MLLSEEVEHGHHFRSPPPAPIGPSLPAPFSSKQLVSRPNVPVLQFDIHGLIQKHENWSGVQKQKYVLFLAAPHVFEIHPC